MDIVISNVNIRYRDDDIDSVDVRFEGNGEQLNFSGHFTLTPDEYAENKDTAKLVKYAKDKMGMK